jgi:nitric oxide reductase subunit B
MDLLFMEAMALTVMAFRQVLSDKKWARPEKYIRVPFWGLNPGLAVEPLKLRAIMPISRIDPDHG